MQDTKLWLEDNELGLCWDTFKFFECDTLDNVQFLYKNHMLCIEFQNICEEKFNLTTKSKLYLLLIDKFGDIKKKKQAKNFNDMINVLETNSKYMLHHCDYIHKIYDLSVYLCGKSVSNVQTLNINHLLKVIIWWNRINNTNPPISLNFNGFRMVIGQLIEYINNKVQILNTLKIQVYKAIGMFITLVPNLCACYCFLCIFLYSFDW